MNNWEMAFWNETVQGLRVVEMPPPKVEKAKDVHHNTA